MLTITDVDISNGGLAALKASLYTYRFTHINDVVFTLHYKITLAKDYPIK
ncbi:hypothetical protein WJR50_30590 [Catalinimonas sp. 4WD22]